MEDRDPSPADRDGSHDAALEAALERFEEAQESRDRQEQLTARLALCLALIDAGWVPPQVVRDQMDRDERALRRLRHADVVDLRDVLDLTGWRWPRARQG